MEKSQHLIIAGLPRAGTTSLYTYLASHPDICASSVKETQFFLPVFKGGSVPPAEKYLKYFTRARKGMIRMEASPTYFFGGRPLAEKIKEYLWPTPRIVLVFRSPTDRLFSYFTHEKMTGRLDPNLSFDEYLCTQEMIRAEIVRHGNYAELMKAWHEIFYGNIQVHYFEDLKEDPRDVCEEVCEWLGLNTEIYRDFKFTVENKGRLYRNRTLHLCARKLNEVFEPFLRRHHRMKLLLRGFYTIVNEQNRNTLAMSPAARAKVDEIYEPINRELATFFSQMGYPVRGWLKLYEH